MENKFFSSLQELLKKNDRNFEALKLREAKTITSIYLYSYKLGHFKKNKNIHYFCLNQEMQNLLDEYSVQYIKMNSNSDAFTLRINIDNTDVVRSDEDLWLKIFNEIYSKVGSETYSCCSRWLACSDALACVNPEHLDAMGCQYKKNLEKGLVFYGKNNVFDENHKIDEVKIQRNINNMRL